MNHLINKVIKVPVLEFPKPDTPDYFALVKPKKLHWTYHIESAPSWNSVKKEQPWL